MEVFLMYILSVFHIWFGTSTALKLGDANACEMNNTDGKIYITCCAGYIYQQEQNNCQDCPSGTYGRNCKYTCKPNFYGVRCKSECNCNKTEKCNPITGACDDISASLEGNNAYNTDYNAVIHVVVAIVAVLLVIGLTVLVLIRWKSVTCLFCMTGVFASTSRSHTFIESRPAEIQFDDEDPYAEIRESNMIPLTGYGRQTSLMTNAGAVMIPLTGYGRQTSLMTNAGAGKIPLTGYERQTSIMTNAEVGHSGGHQSIEQEPSTNEYGEPLDNLLFVDNKE